MIFGINPREGYFKDGVFYHPDLAFKLSFPQGWKTSNQRQAVSAINEAQDALMQLTLAQDADTGAAVQRFVGQEGVEGGQVQNTRVNGLDASWATFEVPSEQSPLAGRVVCIRYGENTFQLMALAKRDSWAPERSRRSRASQRSFARLTDRRFLDVQPARREARAAAPGDDPARVLRALSVDHRSRDPGADQPRAARRSAGGRHDGQAGGRRHEWR